MSQGLLTPPTPRLARPRKRWTIAEFDRLTAGGFIREGSRTYLWDGEIYEPMSENPPHITAVSSLADLLKVRFHAADWTVLQGAPLVLEEFYKPQPDLLVVRGPRSTYGRRLAVPEDVALLVKVSATTYADDSGAYLRKYAAGGIPRYWIVNVPLRRVEVYETPVPTDAGTHTYQKRTDYGLGMTVPLEVNHGAARVVAEVAVIDILRDSLEPVEGEGRA